MSPGTGTLLAKGAQLQSSTSHGQVLILLQPNSDPLLCL